MSITSVLQHGITQGLDRFRSLKTLTDSLQAYDPKRKKAESRFSTRALGDNSELGIPPTALGTDTLTPSTSVRPIDELLNMNMQFIKGYVPYTPRGRR